MPQQTSPKTLPFGADFIPFDIVDNELRGGDEIIGKRKHDQVDAQEPEQRQPKLARYEDGSFTTPWMRNMRSNAPKDAADLWVTALLHYS